MSQAPTVAEELAALRSRAASRLTADSGRRGSPSGASDALAVLHALASAPETAGDALALLHELQVHQVELDMQAEALRESRAELEAALQQQIALYDRQPVGCFTIDLRRHTLHDLNLTGAKMLGVDRSEAEGQAIDLLLSPASARALRDWLTAAGASEAQAVLPLQLASRGGQVNAHVRNDPADHRCRVALAVLDEPLAQAPK